MTGSIHHQDRPVCIRPKPPESEMGVPCHPAIAEVVTEEEGALLLCDWHVVDLIDKNEATITEVAIVEENGQKAPAWWVDRDPANGPDIQRVWRYCKRAYVDYGCCLPGQTDPDVLDYHEAKKQGAEVYYLGSP